MATMADLLLYADAAWESPWVFHVMVALDELNVKYQLEPIQRPIAPDLKAKLETNAILGLVPTLATITSLLELLWWIALLVTTASSPTKQGLHDRFANTAVVQPEGPRSAAVTACLVIVVLGIGLLLLSVIALVVIGSQFSAVLSAAGE